MKVCAVEAELFHADGQTDIMKLIVAFRNFTKAPDIFKLLILYIGNDQSITTVYW